jgi:hypothetical protein
VRAAGLARRGDDAAKEALRRLRPVPDGHDLVREAYGSDEFRSRVRAFFNR